MKRKRLFVLLFILTVSIVIYLMNPFGLKDEEMEKFLAKAVKDGDLKQVRSLRAKGADIDILNAKGETLLHLAVGYGHQKTAEFLILKGINVNAQDKNGNKIVMRLLEKENQSALKRMSTSMISPGV